MRRSVRAFVRERARNRCEYCRLHERDSPLYAFQIEHIIPLKHHGTDEPDNLAWSCLECNLGKSSNLSGRHPTAERVVPLFHPRRQKWSRHFTWDGGTILGRTTCGHVTVDVLNINQRDRVKTRTRLVELGRLPPDDD